MENCLPAIIYLSPIFSRSSLQKATLCPLSSSWQPSVTSLWADAGKLKAFGTASLVAGKTKVRNPVGKSPQEWLATWWLLTWPQPPPQSIFLSLHFNTQLGTALNRYSWQLFKSGNLLATFPLTASCGGWPWRNSDCDRLADQGWLGSRGHFWDRTGQRDATMGDDSTVTSPRPRVPGRLGTVKSPGKDASGRGGRHGRKNSTHPQLELEVGTLSKGRGRSCLPPPHSRILMP